MAQAFPQQQQQQQQSSYMGGQFPEYAQQPRYGGVPHAAYGVLPYAAVPPAQYLPQGMPAPDGGYDAEALALAQGMNNMVLAPGQQQMVQIQQGQYYAPHQQQRMPAGYGPPAGYGYPPQQGPGNAGLRGPPLGQQQQQYQQHPGQQGMGPPMGMNGRHHMQDMRGGPMQNGRGDPPGPRMMGPGPGPRGMGMQQQQQQQMQRGGGRKKVQRGLEDNVRRTVYISYIDQQVTEESLATFFADCGTVMDCRICGDPNSAMRFAFIEFMEEGGAQEALKMTGSTLGKSSLRVLPSKTAIVPVNKELMPRSEEELERCSRTVYVANIDKKVEREDVRAFFEKLCGRIGKIRLLGDLQHSTRIAFIEFIDAEAAMAALNCSGALLGALPLRVSPSKTPVRGDKDDRESRSNRSRNRNNNNQNNNNNQQQQQAAQQQQEGEDGAGSSSQHGSAEGAGAANTEEQQAQAQDEGAASPVRTSEAGSGPSADAGSADAPTETAAAAAPAPPAQAAEAPSGDAQPQESSAGEAPAEAEAAPAAVAAS